MAEEQRLGSGAVEPPVQPPLLAPRRRSRGWLIAFGIVVIGALMVREAPVVMGMVKSHFPGGHVGDAEAYAQPQPQGQPVNAAVASPQSDLYLDHEVSGAEGRSVVVAPRARVLGQVKAGERATIRGTVTGDVEAPVVEVTDQNGGGPATVYGAVHADTVLIAQHGQVLGPVVGKQLLEIAGTVTGNLEAPRIILRATAVVHGDVTVSGGRLVLEPGAVVNGALKGGESGVSLQMPAAADKSGRSDAQAVPLQPASPIVYRTPPLLEYGLAGLAAVLGLMAMTALCRVFLPDQVDEIAAALERRPWRSLLTGIWTLLLAGLAGFVLAVIIIGIPVTVVLALVAAALLILGITADSDLAGRRLLAALGRQGALPLQGTAAGALSLGLLLCVPILGWLLVLLAAIASFGAGAAIWYPRVRTAWQNRRRQPASG